MKKILLLIGILLSGCATETSQTVVVSQVNSAQIPFSGIKTPMAVGKFDNRSSFMRGMFSDGVDRLGGHDLLSV